ncbi:hypothetical protein B0T14DRAFT_276158 [Immersiella caudata]|uniref:Uncharacterized protein n=1 Tax=Immersiella caudata TaxID=314043 RepID=A0AA39WDB6_9PEZI|nr:hypothetical protein B0T14DRAFT_276158 [Immersiella caudata]
MLKFKARGNVVDEKSKKTYNTRDSLVVTDPTTSLALTGLSMGERTGSRVLQWVWSYVVVAAARSPFDSIDNERLGHLQDTLNTYPN